MIEEIPSLQLIYSSTVSLIWLLRNGGMTQITHVPVLSNLNMCTEIVKSTFGTAFMLSHS